MKTKYWIVLLAMCLLLPACKKKQPYRIPKYYSPSYEQSVEEGYSQANVIYCDKEFLAYNITLFEDGVKYDVKAVGGQVMLFFKDNVTHEEALKIIENNNAKVIAQIPYLKYYLVEVHIGTEGEFVSLMRNISDVDFVYPNIIGEICTASPYVIDNFNGDHGEKVTTMLSGCDPLMNITTYNVGQQNEDHGINTYKAIESVEKALKNLPDGEGAVFNMSFGPGLIKLWDIIPWQHRVLWNDRFVTEDNKASYERRYINGLKTWTKLASKFDNKDFVFVKAAGNEGMNELETILDDLKKELSPLEISVFERHFIIVSAKDDNKEGNYPNDVSSYHKMVTKVDISDMTAQDLHWQGTSFSSPRVAGYITNAANEYNMKVIDVLEHVRTVTRKAPNHILIYELLEREIDNMGVKNKDTDYVMDKEDLRNELGGTKWHLKHKSKLGSKNTHEEWEFMNNGTIKITFYKGSEIKNIEYSWRYYYDNKLNKWKIWNLNCKDARKKYAQEGSDDYNAEYIDVYDYIHNIPQEDFYDYLHSFDFLNSTIYYCNTYLLVCDTDYLKVSDYTNVIHTLSKMR